MRRSLFALGLVCLAAHGGISGAAAQTLADYDYEYLRFRGIGVDAGYIWPTTVEPTIQYGFRIDLGYLGPGVRIIPSIAYWRSQLVEQELADLATRINQQPGSSVLPEDLGPIEWSDLSLSLDGHFVWNVPFGVLTYVGMGVGFHALNGQGPAIDDTIVEDLLDAITMGASALGGLEAEPFHRVRVYTEGRYTVMNSIQYLSARAGLQFMLMTDPPVRVGAALPAPALDDHRETP